jgi:hypothetical protein
MKGKCPFGNRKCEECVLYRKGLRYFDDNKKPEPFEECAINIGVDCLENLVGRSIGNQKATEQTRNEMTKLNELLYGMAKVKLLEKQ